jgi:carboxylesterase type B
MHTVSKPSEFMYSGLFHRAISMSGVAVAPIARCEDPLRAAQYQARLVNCSSNSTSALVDCLRCTDAATLVRTYTAVSSQTASDVLTLLRLSGHTLL